VDCLVRLLEPSLGEVIQDPALGTGGFLISAEHHIRQQYSDADYAASPPSYQGVEIERDTYRLCLMNFFLHGMQGMIVHGDALTDDAAALDQADVIIANPPFGSSAGSARARRSDLPFSTSNKQLLFLQHIYLGLKLGGRAAVVAPDNVLFEEGTGRRVRTALLETCDLHTILRLPTGIFYATSVNTNVLMFTRNHDKGRGTECVWVYDLRTNIPKFTKGRPISTGDFADFEAAFGNDPYGQAKRNDQGPEGRFRCFSRREIAERGDNLDIRWLREREEAADQILNDPEVIATAVISTLQAALLEIEAVAAQFEQDDR
jgi:type I restriction enzyme M protein